MINLTLKRKNKHQIEGIIKQEIQIKMQTQIEGIIKGNIRLHALLKEIQVKDLAIRLKTLKKVNAY